MEQRKSLNRRLDFNLLHDSSGDKEVRQKAGRFRSGKVEARPSQTGKTGTGRRITEVRAPVVEELGDIEEFYGQLWHIPSTQQDKVGKQTLVWIKKQLVDEKSFTLADCHPAKQADGENKIARKVLMAEWGRGGRGRGGGGGGRWRLPNYFYNGQFPPFNPFFYPEGEQSTEPPPKVEAAIATNKNQEKDDKVQKEEVKVNLGNKDSVFVQVICYNCGVPGHHKATCGKPKICFICREEGHEVEKCPVKEQSVEVAKYVGNAASGLGFYNIEIQEEREQRLMDFNNCGKVYVESGEITKEELTRELALFNPRWPWQIRQIDDWSYLVRFPPNKKVEDMADYNSINLNKEDWQGVFQSFYEVVRMKIKCRDQTKIPKDRLFCMKDKLYMITVVVEKSADQPIQGNGGDGGNNDDDPYGDDEADDLEEDETFEGKKNAGKKGDKTSMDTEKDGNQDKKVSRYKQNTSNRQKHGYAEEDSQRGYSKFMIPDDALKELQREGMDEYRILQLPREMEVVNDEGDFISEDYIQEEEGEFSGSSLNKCDMISTGWQTGEYSMETETLEGVAEERSDEITEQEAQNDREEDQQISKSKKWGPVLAERKSSRIQNGKSTQEKAEEIVAKRNLEVNYTSRIQANWHLGAMKKEFGGLGVPNLRDLNLCLLGSWVKRNSSPFWKGVMYAARAIKFGYKWMIGDELVRYQDGDACGVEARQNLACHDEGRNWSPSGPVVYLFGNEDQGPSKTSKRLKTWEESAEEQELVRLQKEMAKCMAIF
ncbi:hypothetical protein PR202_ga17620 [Eleusine coracana subsp. coracana]|uniref:CCHC-type domain-containing protein n=1 Tax=Eleusine coracana subsp. coracana TaxID=191504 RepID=A0AAV5CQK5_ELECO|nr:hypothetical protein PR202_ga17373 [Eleusine coracana subsp. coracana]GJN00438.1 hypothetical protein PR202_ga17620 [Eleusine coracana subsp. coracana]